MSQSRFPSPWSVKDIDGCFVVKASNDRLLMFIYTAKDWPPIPLLTRKFEVSVV